MVSTESRVVFFNVRGARFSTKNSWLNRRSQVLKRLNRVLRDSEENMASLYVLAECRQNEIPYLRDKMPGYGVVAYETSGIAVFYLKSAWKYKAGRHWTQEYNKGTHGALVVELTNAVNGQTINLGGAHLVPFSWRQAKRKADLKRLLGMVDGWNDPTIIAMDSNWARSQYNDFLATIKPYGFHSLREDAATKIRADYQSTGAFKVGAKPIDMMIGTVDKVVSRGFRTLEGWGSDHHMITEQTTITTIRSDTT